MLAADAVPLQQLRLFASLPVLRAVFEAQETGLLLAVPPGRVVVANRAMGALIGSAASELEGLSTASLMDRLAELVDECPELLQTRRLFPRGGSLVGEEIEIRRPSRSVIRWVAQEVDLAGEPAQLVTCTDITAEVDLVAAQQKLAMTDRLTGLMNRRGAEQLILRETARAQRIGAPLCFLLLDVDHFKRVNDVHGHAAGDAVLQTVASRVASGLRACDAVVRWGGEEFLAVLTGCDIAGARVCAERVRAAVEGTPTSGGRVTISVGVAQLERGEPPAAAISRADQRLYEAKASGRNRVC
jgi:diguanylate cyclase (GGDEF)-like protein/PAS domain S-box-containing protein